MQVQMILRTKVFDNYYADYKFAGKFLKKSGNKFLRYLN